MGEKRKKMAVLIPCLEGAGGISVLKGLFISVQKLGYQIVVYSMLEGSMREIFEGMGITVTIQADMLSDNFQEQLDDAEAIFVNTLQMVPVIQKLEKKYVNIHWWIHEPPAYFMLYRDQISNDFFQKLNENVHVYAAGNLVHDYIWNQFHYNAEVLNFGIRKLENKGKKSIIGGGLKKNFLLPSYYFDYLKGQDLLLKAILNLPQEYLSRSEFYFLGIVEEDMKGLYQIILKLEQAWGNVHYIPVMKHSELLDFMKKMDCLVAPSREDATNACIVEGLMLSKLCICSDMTGVARYLEDEKSALVFPSENVEELTKKLMLVIDGEKDMEQIRECGHWVYETVFSEQIFDKHVRKIFGAEC